MSNIPFTPWNVESNSSATKKEKYKTKREIQPGFSNVLQFAQRPSNEELLSMQAFMESEERRKTSEVQQNQLDMYNFLFHQKKEEIERMATKEVLLEEQLKLMTAALTDKKLQLQKTLRTTKKQLSDLEETERKFNDDELWELDQLIQLSIQAKEHSYSPYSNFRVGCILKTQSGEYYKGCNVENASYGLAICAERTALVKAVSEGHRKFSMIVINSDLATGFCAPCGACRQFMSEFGDFEVYLTKPDKTYKRFTVGELLPESFQQSDLEDTKRNKT